MRRSGLRPRRSGKRLRRLRTQFAVAGPWRSNSKPTAAARSTTPITAPAAARYGVASVPSASSVATPVRKTPPSTMFAAVACTVAPETADEPGKPARCNRRIRKTAAVAPPAGTAWLNPAGREVDPQQLQVAGWTHQNQRRHCGVRSQEAASRASAVIAIGIESPRRVFTNCSSPVRHLLQPRPSRVGRQPPGRSKTGHLQPAWRPLTRPGSHGQPIVDAGAVEVGGLPWTLFSSRCRLARRHLTGW